MYIVNYNIWNYTILLFLLKITLSNSYLFKRSHKYKKNAVTISNIKIDTNLLYSNINDIIIDEDLISIDNKFYKNGLPFTCTGCGGCCQMDGEVWLDSNEFLSLVGTLGLPAEDVIDIYIDEIIAGWVKLKNGAQVQEQTNNKIVTEQCIFLEKDTKRCTIYESRPVQCRTYPYWPAIIANSKTWDNEAVLPISIVTNVNNDSILSNNTITQQTSSISTKKYWTYENGGCEGVNHKDAELVPSLVIHRNSQLYEIYQQDFPYSALGDDRQKLLARIDVMERVIRSTRLWVEEFVIGYKLCPFADTVFSNEKVKYRVLLESDRSKIIERLKLEVLELMLIPEEVSATTLLMIPFAFPDFEKFYQFSLDLEDIILPSIEELSKPCFDDNTDNINNNNIDDIDNSEIQLAFFHPTFAWADTPINNALNFEKRAPFPTINLLRAKKIREYANQAKTTKIANNNALILESVGGETLSIQFNNIIKSALA